MLKLYLENRYLSTIFMQDKLISNVHMRGKTDLEEDIDSSMEETPLDSWVSNRLWVRKCLQMMFKKNLGKNPPSHWVLLCYITGKKRSQRSKRPNSSHFEDIIQVCQMYLKF